MGTEFIQQQKFASCALMLHRVTDPLFFQSKFRYEYGKSILACHIFSNLIMNILSEHVYEIIKHILNN